jgi:hypothetical protein
MSEAGNLNKQYITPADCAKDGFTELDGRHGDLPLAILHAGPAESFSDNLVAEADARIMGTCARGG